MSCGTTKAKTRLKTELIDSNLIDRYNNVKDYAKTLEKMREISKDIGEVYGIKEDLAVFTNNKTKISFKEEIMRLIDAKNDIFYPSNRHLKNESPFNTTFLGLTANFAENLYPLDVSYMDKELGTYFTYDGQVYISLGIEAKDNDIYVKGFNPYSGDINVLDSYANYKNKKAVLSINQGALYFLTPSNQAIDISKRTVIDSDDLIKRLRRNALYIDNLELTDDVLKYLHWDAQSLKDYETYKDIAIPLIKLNKNYVPLEDLRNQLKCM